MKITFTKFDPDDNTSTVLNAEGKDIGYIERVLSLDEKKWGCSTSRSTDKFLRVTGYTVTMWDERVDNPDGEFETLAEARAKVRAIAKEFGL